ncbi:hypothetical protein HNR68_001525 [Saccharopolyspora hordei]|uniref:Uncharacterized protein n=1 Tax=Saccharopolyspora hordei TaxID=1838 RepID=A0A853AFI4_9PSEU|nr:hypothetical protein [Saccharopolyspora hordei]
MISPPAHRHRRSTPRMAESPPEAVVVIEQKADRFCPVLPSRSGPGCAGAPNSPREVEDERRDREPEEQPGCGAYWRVRTWATTAPTENSTSPTAAAVPRDRAPRSPATSPTAPAALRVASTGSHDCGTCTAAELARTNPALRRGGRVRGAARRALRGRPGGDRVVAGPLAGGRRARWSPGAHRRGHRPARRLAHHGRQRLRHCPRPGVLRPLPRPPRRHLPPGHRRQPEPGRRRPGTRRRRQPRGPGLRPLLPGPPGPT